MNLWTTLAAGLPIPGVKLLEPPRIISTDPSDAPSVQIDHGAAFIGLTASGNVSICRYDGKTDRFTTIDGSPLLTNGKFARPRWLIPIRLERVDDDWNPLKFDGPWVAQDATRKREWVFTEFPRCYVVKTDAGWAVTDREMDVPASGGPHKTREAAIREFYKMNGHPIPTGSRIGKFDDSVFE